MPAHAYTWRWEPFPWSAEYAETDEIERYFDFMAKKYFLPGGVTYNATVQSATWHEDICKWEVRVAVKDPATGAVEERVDFADFVINGGGILHTPNVPKFEGMDQFKGRIMHSARYDRSVSLKDKVVAVVGNGSSGIGIIGTIKDEVKGLHAYQRRPTWIVAQLGQPDPTKLSSLIYGPEEKKQWADKKYWYDFYKNNWLNNDTIYPMFLKGSQESLFATAMARIMMENLVKDPELRKHLSPSYPVGCRRPTPHHGYFEALQLPKTQIIRSGVSRFTKNGIVDQDGVERPCDVVILATGYEVTYRPTFKITGRNGRVLQEEWKDCPEGFKAVMVSGYPNYFSIYGPIAPVASNSIVGLLDLFVWVVSSYLLFLLRSRPAFPTPPRLPLFRPYLPLTAHDFRTTSSLAYPSNRLPPIPRNPRNGPQTRGPTRLERRNGRRSEQDHLETGLRVLVQTPFRKNHQPLPRSLDRVYGHVEITDLERIQSYPGSQGWKGFGR